MTDTTTGNGLRYWGNSGAGVLVDVRLADGQQRHVHVDRGDAAGDDAVTMLPAGFGDELPVPVSVQTLAGLRSSGEWSTATTQAQHDEMMTAAREAAEAAVMTAAEEADVTDGVESGDVMDDAQLATWVEEGSVSDLLAAVGEDVVLAKRVLSVEQARGADARKGLTGPLVKLTTREQE